MLHVLGLFVALLGLWLLASGIFTPLIIGLGVMSAILVVIIAVRMDIIDREAVPIHLGWRIIPYWLWLIWQIVVSNIAVAIRILEPRLSIAPTIVRVPVMQRTELGQVIFANSITLTPGTVTIDLHQGEATVHALFAKSADGVTDNNMNRRVARVEG